MDGKKYYMSAACAVLSMQRTKPLRLFRVKFAMPNLICKFDCKDIGGAKGGAFAAPFF